MSCSNTFFDWACSLSKPRIPSQPTLSLTLSLLPASLKNVGPIISSTIIGFCRCSWTNAARKDHRRQRWWGSASKKDISIRAFACSSAYAVVALESAVWILATRQNHRSGARGKVICCVAVAGTSTLFSRAATGLAGYFADGCSCPKYRQKPAPCSHVARIDRRALSWPLKPVLFRLLTTKVTPSPPVP